jgi:hypothetical protein
LAGDIGLNIPAAISVARLSRMSKRRMVTPTVGPQRELIPVANKAHKADHQNS